MPNYCRHGQPLGLDTTMRVGGGVTPGVVAIAGLVLLFTVGIAYAYW